MQGTIDQSKFDMSAELEKNGVPAEHHKSVMDAESARLIEAHDVTHGEAAAALEAELPRPKRWLDFLQEKAIGNGDPVIAALVRKLAAPLNQLSVARRMTRRARCCPT